MLRVVFDTVIFVRSLINPFGIWGQLIFDHAEEYELYLSPPILQEILEVLERPAIKRKYRTIIGRGMIHLLDIFSQANVVEIAEIKAASRDPEDNKFLTTAEVAGAQYLISEDGDLLDLEEYQGMKIINAETFLRILKQGEQGET
ncbi:MAG: putative toxin-antitoxin system toxin component, PIN family [Chloroflexi bacterium]|nr:putative toxin-antitoxin system toxin component, PIN family [Chloroflexota bacterium]MCL5076158.1 putative toxin-antitoxin system toxin component, PIN family [Chloroflexota bacterium]